MRDGGVLLSELCSLISTLTLQCLHALSPMGHRAVAMEAAVKPGTGSAKPFGAMVSPAGYGEQRFGGNIELRAGLGLLLVEHVWLLRTLGRVLEMLL